MAVSKIPPKINNVHGGNDRQGLPWPYEYSLYNKAFYYLKY